MGGHGEEDEPEPRGAEHRTDPGHLLLPPLRDHGVSSRSGDGGHGGGSRPISRSTLASTTSPPSLITSSPNSTASAIGARLPRTTASPRPTALPATRSTLLNTRLSHARLSPMEPRHMSLHHLVPPCRHCLSSPLACPLLRPHTPPAARGGFLQPRSNHCARERRQGADRRFMGRRGRLLRSGARRSTYQFCTAPRIVCRPCGGRSAE